MGNTRHRVYTGEEAARILWRHMMQEGGLDPDAVANETLNVVCEPTSTGGLGRITLTRLVDGQQPPGPTELPSNLVGISRSFTWEQVGILLLKVMLQDLGHPRAAVGFRMTTRSTSDPDFITLMLRPPEVESPACPSSRPNSDATPTGGR